MGRRTIFLALPFFVASATFSQSIEPASVRAPGPRPITKSEGRAILAAIATVDPDSNLETDCSHLVHEVFEKAGFSYDYASSRDLYMGDVAFTRVRAPQAGDLVVWRGHVGIVIDPKEHSFFSFVRSGPDTQFYDSTYWRSRGSARFYRYLTEKSLRSSRTLEAANRAEREDTTHSSENQPSSRAGELTPTPSTPSADPSDSRADLRTDTRANPKLSAPSLSDTGTAEAPKKVVVQVAGKKPAPEEIAAAFVEMNQDYCKALRANGFGGRPGMAVVVYRELRVARVEIKGKRGIAVVRVESIGSSESVETSARPRRRELSLELQKTKSGWVMSAPPDTNYVSREGALQALSARLAHLTESADGTSEVDSEQKRIIRFLNLLVGGDAKTVSAQN